jgi:hypothetical protein
VSGFSRTERLGFAGAFVLGLAIVLLPVAVRNYAVSGGFYITTSQAGPNFYIGNNPKADGSYMSLRYGRGAPEFERQDATELAEHALGRTLTPGEVSGYWTDKAFAHHEPAWLLAETRRPQVRAAVEYDRDARHREPESYAEWSWPLRLTGWFSTFGVLVPLALSAPSSRGPTGAASASSMSWSAPTRRASSCSMSSRATGSARAVPDDLAGNAIVFGAAFARYRSRHRHFHLELCVLRSLR